MVPRTVVPGFARARRLRSSQGIPTRPAHVPAVAVHGRRGISTRAVVLGRPTVNSENAIFFFFSVASLSLFLHQREETWAMARKAVNILVRSSRKNFEPHFPVQLWVELKA